MTIHAAFHAHKGFNMDQNEYKFPDEDVDVEKAASAEVEVEIVDDTPASDKGRKPLEKEVDVPEDEVAQYGEKVQKRIKELKHGYHDERRAKEAAQRERDEALAFAKARHEEALKLRETLDQGHKSYAEMAKSAAKTRLDVAKDAYKKAYESGDADALVAAQETLNNVQAEFRSAESWRPPAATRQDEEFNVNSQPTPQQPSKVDEKAAKWQARNAWFGADDEMTSFALGVHKKLVDSGLDPRSDEYYERIDSRVREVFSDYFGQEKPKKPRATSVVAPATRSTAPKRVTLTTSQVAIARRLGVTPEQYAKQLIALES